MPGRDSTGPMGRGAMSGRGLGVCTGVNVARRGVGRGLGLGRGDGRGNGRGFGRGVRRGFVQDLAASISEKELLHEQKQLLEERLDVINKQLESL